MQEMFDSSLTKQWTSLNNYYYLDPSYKRQIPALGTVSRVFSIDRQCMMMLAKSPSKEMQQNCRISQNTLKHHYILRYFGQLQIQGTLYILLDYCPNGTLRDCIGKLQQQEVLKLFRQLVQGMVYFQSKRKAHRDLKPENIMLGPQKDLKIGDFGIGGQTQSIFKTGMLGTAIYAAPEVFLNDNDQENSHSQKSDVWSAGMILYEMLTGNPLFHKAVNYDDLKEEWLRFERTPSISLPSHFHPIWQCFLSWMLTFDCQTRPSFQEILSKLRLVYGKMMGELRKGECLLSSPLSNLQCYLEFMVGKYQLLVDVCERFTIEDIRLCNEFKYLIMFCCIMRYLTFCESFLLELRNRKLRMEGNNLIENSQQSDNCYTEMLIVKTQAQLLQKSTFYHHQIKNTIVPKILYTYCQRQQSQIILDDLKHIVQLVKQTQTGQPIASEEVYDQSFQLIRSVIQKKQGDVVKFYTDSELKVYLKVLKAMLLTQKYPNSKYNQKGIFLKEEQTVRIMKRDALIDLIRSLENQVI